ncbi:MAG: dTDP-4-amino-4,6-dideoxygalactose transaminase, partial [Cyclobacteriaceae bacterium]|nr:dTDP-4-amino-4,6-dideoxygalactose transaminase [Cyclobacteriaceae bacterium]
METIKPIRFNFPYVVGNEETYIKEAINIGHLSGNGIFTKKCQKFFEDRYHIKKCLLTTSCTDALEMAAILLNIEPGDEVIVPSYTFVSSALAFIRQGAKIVFVDSREDHPGMDERKVEELISSKTKAIVAVHYAGVACDMDVIMDVARRHGLFVVEDAAQGIEATYKGKQLGTIGHLGTFSFHETKNIHCGEGGLLLINDEQFVHRSEIIWEKGTNRAEFFRGEVNKYGWVDTGSSFLPSELNAAFLWGQLNALDSIQAKRMEIWNSYFTRLAEWADLNDVSLPCVPSYVSHNAHMFYLILNDLQQRTLLIEYLKSKDISAVFHYQSLNKSQFYSNRHCSGLTQHAD